MQQVPPPQPPPPGELRDRIRQVIEETQQAVAQARSQDAATAQSNAPSPGADQPTAVVAIPRDPNMLYDIPPRAADVAMLFFVTMFAIIVFLPIARAIGRWMDRRGQAPARLPAEATAQLTQLAQSVDAIAIEVERISEGQRFTTKLLADAQARRGSLLAQESSAARAQE